MLNRHLKVSSTFSTVNILTLCPSSGGSNRISIWSATVPSSTISTSKTTSVSPTATAKSWSYVGCYLDTATRRTLPNLTPTIGGGSVMTIPACQEACKAAGYSYAGAQAGQECWCGNTINVLSPIQPATSCSTPCTGNPSQICGGNSYLSSIYLLSAASNRPWVPLGCYIDTVANRTLETIVNGAPGSDHALTIPRCQAVCEGRRNRYSGVENGNECHCGDAIRASGAVTLASEW